MGDHFPINALLVQIISNVQRFKVFVHDTGSVPWRETLDDSSRQVSRHFTFILRVLDL